MRFLIAGLLAISTLAVAVPASAQGIYVGPGGPGVGVGVGARPYDGGRYYRDGDWDDDPIYEGRSANRDRYIEDYDDF